MPCRHPWKAMSLREMWSYVALLAINVGCKSIAAPSFCKLRLGRRHPGSSVSPFALALAPGGRMAFSGEPLLKDGSACGSPELVDHGEQADGPLGQRTVVILLGEQRNDSPRQTLRPSALSLHLGEDLGQVVERLLGQCLEIIRGPRVQALGFGPGYVPHHVPEEVICEAGAYAAAPQTGGPGVPGGGGLPELSPLPSRLLGHFIRFEQRISLGIRGGGWARASQFCTRHTLCPGICSRMRPPNHSKPSFGQR